MPLALLKVVVGLVPPKVPVGLRAMLLKLAAMGLEHWHRQAALHRRRRLGDIAETNINKALGCVLEFLPQLGGFYTKPRGYSNRKCDCDPGNLPLGTVP